MRMDFALTFLLTSSAAFFSCSDPQETPSSVEETLSTEQDFRSETIYFVIITRFFDGDETNNFYNRDRIKPGDPHWRGDFKGLIERLDYIADLGFSAVWITPPVENRSGLDYHGYHAYDWNRVDPRLESSDATYQDFIDQAHSKGLKVIQDVVINHSSNYGIRDEVWVERMPHKYFRMKHGGNFQWPYEKNLGNYQTAHLEDNDNSKAPDWFRQRQTTDAAGSDPLSDPIRGESFHQFIYDPNRFFSTDAGRLDGNWYHPHGWVNGGDWENPWSVQNKHLAGDCLDLATERSNVRDYLNAAIEKYIAMGIDGIRLDTAKHLERDELLSYVNAWKKKKPDLFVFGEVMVKGLGFGDIESGDNGPSSIRPWWYTRTGNDPRNPNSGGDSGLAVLDFSLFSTFRDNVSHGNFSGLQNVFNHDWIYGDATKLVTFLQNHDVGPDNDFKYRFGKEHWKAAVTYNLLWTVRGIPSLYYGEEIEFKKGAPADVIGAHDTLDQTGRAYFGDHLKDEEIANTAGHPLYQHIKRLNQLRRAIPALQKAPMRNVQQEHHALSFIRDHNNGQSYVVVGLTASYGHNFSISGIRNGTYRDAVTGGSIDVQQGKIDFWVRPNSIGLWVLDGPGMIGKDGVYLRR